MATVEELAFAAFPHLVQIAQGRRTVTYGDLAARINSHHRPLNKALGFIRDDICTPMGLPIITAIVVKKGTEIPGMEFLHPNHKSHRSSGEEFKNEFEVQKNLVFDYPHWNVALADLGLKEVDASVVEGAKSVALAAVPKRNPPWCREELILALDYYLSHPLPEHGASNPGIIELSATLNKLPFHLDRPDAGRFRNPNSCEMKLCNFRAFDPNYEGKGLAAGSRLDEEIWNEFYERQEALAAEAKHIRAVLADPVALQAVSQAVDGETEHSEGALKWRLHLARERSSKLVENAKMAWFKKNTLMPCERCGFSFKKTFGIDFIEAHHRKPIGELNGATANKIEDLMPVCANCHRAIHKVVDMHSTMQGQSL